MTINDIVFLKVFFPLAYLRYKRSWQEKIYSLGLLGNLEIIIFLRQQYIGVVRTLSGIYHEVFMRKSQQLAVNCFHRKALL